MALPDFVRVGWLHYDRRSNLVGSVELPDGKHEISIPTRILNAPPGEKYSDQIRTSPSGGALMINISQVWTFVPIRSAYKHLDGLTKAVLVSAPRDSLEALQDRVKRLAVVMT